MKRVYSVPVQAPASIPAPKPASDASGGLVPCTMQRRGDGCAESDRSIGGDVGKRKNPEADEHAQRQQRENEPNRERANQKIHVRCTSHRISDAAPIQHAPRTNSLCCGPAASRSSVSRCSTPCRLSVSNKVVTVAFRSMLSLLERTIGKCRRMKMPRRPRLSSQWPKHGSQRRAFGTGGDP